MTMQRVGFMQRFPGPGKRRLRGDRAAREIDGTISGLPFNLWGTIAGGEGCQQDINNPLDDTDANPSPENPERGIQMHMNFTAVRAEWNE